MMKSTTEFIEKEQVAQLKFSGQEVLTHPEDIKKRAEKLDKALKLGNLNKTHVNIGFRTAEGSEYHTLVTVWAVTELFVELKGGTTIPIKSILDIEPM